MLWYVVIAVALLCAGRFFWKVYTDKATVLVRQGAAMNWVASGTLHDGKYRNTKFKRGEVEIVLWYKNKNISLLTPKNERKFSNFIELERWLASFDTLEKLDETKNRPLTEEEADYYHHVEEVMRGSKYYDSIVLPAQCFEDFLIASRNLCIAACAHQDPKIIGMLIVDGANKYQHDPSLGIVFLKTLEEKYEAEGNGNSGTTT